MWNYHELKRYEIMKTQEQDKVTVLIGLVVGSKCENDDFKIKMNESDVNQISEKYDAALKASGLDQEEFGLKFYEQLKASAPTLAAAIEEAIYAALQDGLQGELDPEDQSELQEAGFAGPVRDEKGNWYIAIYDGLNFDINLSDWPRTFSY